MEISAILHKIAVTLFIALFSFESFAIDVVKFQRQQMSDKKASHNIEVVRRALEITEPEYGPFKLEIVNLDMSVGRMLKATIEGKIINTVIVPASKRWDNFNIPIRVPVRLGLLSYRVLLINKADLSKFEGVDSIEDLNKLSAGLIRHWVTTGIFKDNGIKIVESGHFEGIFLMLKKQRFDYMPRSIYEVYDELHAREAVLGDIVVEPTLALYIPTSAYIYVSPKSPEIAKRIEAGVLKLLENGQLKEILYKHYFSEIKRANLPGRKFLRIENAYHNEHNKADEKHYLLSY